MFNIYITFPDLELATPPLDKGIILPGVTRDSLLHLGKEYGEFKVSERSFTMEDIRLALKEGRVSRLTSTVEYDREYMGTQFEEIWNSTKFFTSQ